MAFTHALATNNYGTAKFIVSASAANGTHTTISSAITSAAAGDTIYIRDGTYTEDITLDVSTKSGLTISASNGDQNSPSVIVVGKWTLSGAGTISFGNIRFQTNSDYFLSVGGSAATIVYCSNCYLNATNNTGIQYTTASTASSININGCAGNIGTTGITMWTMSSTGNLQLFGCQFLNTGNSTTVSNNSAGQHIIKRSEIAFGVSTSTDGRVTHQYAIINTAAINVIGLDHAGTTGTSAVSDGVFTSGSAACVNIGASAQLQFLSSNTLSSSAAGCVTGTGTAVYNILAYATSTLSSSVSNRTYKTLDVSNLHANSISFDQGTNTLSSYIESGTWTPTLTGASTAGVTTYTAQNGFYTRIGNTYFCHFRCTYTAATGTGNLTLGGLPATVKNTTGYFPTYACRIDGLTLPAASIEVVGQLTTNTLTGNFVGETVAGTAAAVQIASATVTVYGSFFYNV